MGKFYIFTGAGVSADSGISTWRGSDGMWDNEKISEVCDINTWQRHSAKVHNFYSGLRTKLPEYQPNEFHLAVAELSQGEIEVVNMTQNIDDLFERAGCRDVVHLHGRLTEMKCTGCGHVWDISYTQWDTTSSCPNPHGNYLCRTGIKPNVVFFGENAPNYGKLHDAMRGLTPEDTIVVAGTSNAVVDFDAFLFDRPGYKVWMNLDQPKSPAIYDEILIGPASTTGGDLRDISAMRYGTN